MLLPVKEICTNLIGLNQNLKNEHLWSPYKYHSYSRTRSPPNFSSNFTVKFTPLPLYLPFGLIFGSPFLYNEKIDIGLYWIQLPYLEIAHVHLYTQKFKKTLRRFENILWNFWNFLFLFSTQFFQVYRCTGVHSYEMKK